jgi:hypothetical protein
MRERAAELLARLPGDRRTSGRLPFDDPARRRMEYRPRPRAGVSLAELDAAGRKAAHRLLASALSPSAFAQALAVMALEEVLDRAEGGRRNRHSDDYRIVVFGDPADRRWGWRFEGHHVSVSMTLAGDAVAPGPVFLGANPATVSHAGRPVLRPLGPEEDLARQLLSAMPAAARSQAVIAGTAPDDVLSGSSPQAPQRLAPLGVPAGRLGPTGLALLDELVGAYLDRLVPDLAAAEATRLVGTELHFAWAGPTEPGVGHYYRIQGPDLLIEYDNAQDGANHAHTVLRRPAGDFGADLLARHRASDR